MKILVVTQCFFPDVYAINDIVRRLVERGHEVTVLTGLPDYTTSRVPSEYKWFRNRRQDFHGAKVYRTSIIARHHGPIFRCLNYLSFVVTAWLRATFSHWDDFDLIYVWQVSPVTMAVPAIRLKHKLNRPLYLYCLDLWPESVKAMGFDEHSLIFKAVSKWSRRIYKQCDHIACSSISFLSYFKELHSIPAEKLSYVPQFASDELFKLDLRKKEDGHTDFLFIGNIGKVQDVDVIIKAFYKIKDNADWTMHIVGNGSNHDYCVGLTRELGLEGRILFHGTCPMKDTPKYYAGADACIITLNGDNLIGTTLPGKLQTYMAAGKPIIGAINGSGQMVIKSADCGACVNAGDVDGLAELLLDFITNRGKYSACGFNARSYFAQNFTEEKFFSTFEYEMNKLIKEQSAAIGE